MASTSIGVFVPAHITGLFSVHRESEPARTGSRGAGVTLSDGVSVSVEPAERTQVRLEGEPIEVSSVEHVIDAFEIHAAVSIETAIPIGAGFGASGAMALGTAIGFNALSERPRSENEIATIAHVAEVQAGTGLGDVVAQLRGGMPLRLEPGGPNHGRLDGIPGGGRVEYLTMGALDTAEVLTGDIEPINEAGADGLERLCAHPSVETFMAESRRFAASSALLPDDVAEVIGTVEEAGGRASMAMLGRTVFALGTDLSDAGYDPEVCVVDHGGARCTHEERDFYPANDDPPS